jgi:hypothetical protein
MVVKSQDNYMKPENLAKSYRKRDGKTGVSRQYIYQLIEKELGESNSTDIDLFIIDSVYFVKQSKRKS